VVKNFEGIGWLVTGKIAPTELSGPVRIIEEGGRMIEESGFQNGLILTAIISVILAVMNLLPIPALDGGHILFLLIEAIKGSPVKKSIQEGCIQGGFVVLMLFMGVVLVNDVLHLFK
jgi:regulator of sigma E protease